MVAREIGRVYIKLSKLITAFKDQLLVVDISQSIGFDERRSIYNYTVIQTSILANDEGYILRFAQAECSSLNVYI